MGTFFPLLIVVVLPLFWRVPLYSSLLDLGLFPFSLFLISVLLLLPSSFLCFCCLLLPPYLFNRTHTYTPHILPAHGNHHRVVLGTSVKPLVFQCLKNCLTSIKPFHALTGTSKQIINKIIIILQPTFSTKKVIFNGMCFFGKNTRMAHSSTMCLFQHWPQTEQPEVLIS